jgi:hypothetical protein
MVAGRGALAGIALNENEKAAVKTITEKYRAEFEEIRAANLAKGARPTEQMRTQVQALAERERAEIRAALTAEHQAQFDANLAKRPEPGAAGPRGRRPARPPVE